MKLFRGVVLALFCHVNAHVILTYNLPDQRSLARAPDEPPGSPADDLSPEFGLITQQQRDALSAESEQPEDAYSARIGLDVKNPLYSSLGRREKLRMFPALAEKYEHSRRRLPGDGDGARDKRQQGWHIDYGKRSGNSFQDKSAEESRMSLKLWNKMFNSMLENEGRLPSSEALGLENDERMPDRTPFENFLDLVRYQSPEYYDLNFMLNNAGEVDGFGGQMTKRQQGWHIPYGKRSNQVFT